MAKIRMEAPRSVHEDSRRAALHECDVLDGALRESLDGVARLAASLCGAPMGVVSLVDAERQEFCGCAGVEMSGTPRAISFCAWTILGVDPFIVEDAAADPRFADNPLVIGEPGIRFYAGFPLRTSDGYGLGALCVQDTRPRSISEEEISQMKLLAEQVSSLLEMRRWRNRYDDARRAAEQEAAASQAALKELDFQKRALDQHALVTAVDRAGLITHVNDAFCTLSGWSREELVGATLAFDAMEEHSRESCASMIAALMRGGVWKGELCNRSRSGRLYWLASTIVPCCDETGRVTRYVAISTDITERKAAEQRLGEVEEQARLILDAALDAVVSIDALGMVTGWNAQAEAIFGYSAGEAIGRCLDELIVPERYREGHRAGIARFLKQGGGQLLNRRVELWGRHKSGAEIPVELAITPVRCGESIFFSAFIRDITERRRVNEELLRAKDQAEAAVRAKTEFLANMSHEIRTPMTALLGFTELLATDVEYAGSPVRRAEAIQTIRRNGEHLLTIINDVLDVSKIEAGKMKVESVPMSPREIIEEVLELMSIRAFQRGLTLRAEYDDSTPETVLSDPVRFRQIVTNLVSNSIKFTERGLVRIRVSAAARPDGMIDVRVDVEDTGVGIAPEHLGLLFESFWQGDASTTRRFGGTGLGLRISKALAILLGGDIEVESERGRGSVFTVRLVAAPGPRKDAQGGQLPAARASRSEAGELGGVRILLAEDGVDNQRLLSHHLTRAGAKVLVVEHGRAAVDAVTEGAERTGAPAGAFDLIIMDMQMPEMDGYMATRVLREHDVRLPILALTAHAMHNDRQRCLDAGCDDYVAKPTDRATLLAACGRLLGHVHPTPTAVSRCCGG